MVNKRELLPNFRLDFQSVHQYFLLIANKYHTEIEYY